MKYIALMMTLLFLTSCFQKPVEEDTTVPAVIENTVKVEDEIINTEDENREEENIENTGDTEVSEAELSDDTAEVAPKTEDNDVEEENEASASGEVESSTEIESEADISEEAEILEDLFQDLFEDGTE